MKNLFISVVCVFSIFGCEEEMVPMPDPGPSCPYGCPPPGGGGDDDVQPNPPPPPPTPPPTPTYCGDRPPGSGLLLNIQPFGQQCQQWCWAAVSSMLSAYYGRPAAECQLASILATAYSGYQVNCCGYGACSYGVCNLPAQSNELSNILVNSLRIQGQHGYGPLGEQALAQEIENGRPVIVGYRNSFAGHVVLVIGYVRAPNGLTYFRAVDPYYGVFDVTYQQLAYGYLNGSLAWAETWFRLSPWSDGCNRNFDPRCGCN